MARDFVELAILSPDSVANSAPNVWKYSYIMAHPHGIRDSLKVIKKNHKEAFYRTRPKDVVTLRVYSVEGSFIHQGVNLLYCRNAVKVIYVYICENDKFKDYCFAGDIRKLTKKEKLSLQRNFTGVSMKIKSKILIHSLSHIPKLNAIGG